MIAGSRAGPPRTIALTAAANNRSASLASVSAQDVDLSFRVATDKTAAGANQNIYGVARRVSSTDSYRVKLRIATSGAVYVQASQVVSNVETGIGTEVLVTGLTHTANTYIRLRAQLSGLSPTTIKIRAWADGGTEPTTWQYSATNSAASLQAAGGVGLQTYLGSATSNAPVVATFDDFLVTSIGSANTAPVATVALSPASPGTAATATATATKTDAEADPVGLTFVWKVNGTTKRTFSSSSVLVDTLDLSVAGNGDPGDTVSVEVTPNDGTINGGPVSVAAIVATTPVTTTMTLDANGNTTAKGTDTFAYDQPNRLTSATVAGTTETYVYDGDGVRFSRTVGAGAAIRAVSDVNASLPVTLDDGTRKYVWGLGLAYAVSGSTLEIYHTDRLGSVRAITNAAGAITATYRTDESGVQTAATGTSSQPFGFTGEPRDGTALLFLRARYYDPSLGRFTSRDPWAGVTTVPMSLNRTAYVQDNPTTFTDPSGLKALVLDPGPSGPARPVQPTRPPMPTQPIPNPPGPPPQPEGYNLGECGAGILGFYGLGLLGLGQVAGGALLQGFSVTIFGVTFGGAAPVSAAGVIAGGFLEMTGVATEGAAVALIYKTCVSQ